MHIPVPMSALKSAWGRADTCLRSAGVRAWQETRSKVLSMAWWKGWASSERTGLQRCSMRWGRPIWWEKGRRERGEGGGEVEGTSWREGREVEMWRGHVGGKGGRDVEGTSWREEREEWERGRNRKDWMRKGERTGAREWRREGRRREEWRNGEGDEGMERGMKRGMEEQKWRDGGDHKGISLSSMRWMHCKISLY